MDDGSTDATHDWLTTWRSSRQDPRGFDIRYVKHDVNLGLPAARNTGLQASRGEFIQFLDSDDLLCAGKLRAQVEKLATSPGLDYVYGRTHQVVLPDRVLGRLGAPMNPRWPARNIPGHHWHVSGALFRRRVLIEAGPWNEALRSSEDWEYAARIKAVSQRAGYSPDLALLYVVHGGDQMIKQSSRRAHESRRNAIRSVLSVLEQRHETDDVARDMCARALVASAIGFRSIGDTEEMRGTLLEAMRIGRIATRIAARALYAASFVLPAGSFSMALQIARSYRHAS